MMEIKTLKTKNYGSGFSLVDTDLINQLEADFEEAIESLEEATIEIINRDYVELTGRQIHNPMNVVLRNNQDKIKIIEKAYGEKWEDIRRNI